MIEPTELLKALEDIDEAYVREADPAASADKPLRKKPVPRVALIAAAVAAAVAVLAVVLTLTVFNKKEPEQQTPTLPAASETEKQTAEPTDKIKTTEPEKKTAGEPTETAEPTPTTTETAEPTPTIADNPFMLDSGVSIGNYLEQPYAILAIKKATDDLIHRDDIYYKLNESDFRRVECDLIYSHGYLTEYIGNHQELILTIPNMISLGAQFWFPVGELSALNEGDVVICGIQIRCDYGALTNGQKTGIELLAACGGEMGCDRFMNGKLQIDLDDPLSRYHKLCSSFVNHIRELRKEGAWYANGELFERVPENDSTNGATVEEAAAFYKWISEAELAARVSDEMLGRLVGLCSAPCAVFRINRITDEQIHRSRIDKSYINYPGCEADLRKVECEVLFSRGGVYEYDISGISGVTDSLESILAEGTSIWFPEEYLSGLKEGDTVICGVMIAEMSGEYELYAGCFSGMRCGVFEEGKLQIDFTDPGCCYYGGFRYILERLRCMKESGHVFVQKDLFDRIPEKDFKNGATVEEVIGIMKWFDEVEEIAKDEKNALRFLV